MNNGETLYEEKNFAIASFAFAAVTGFCIGGTALANVIGIPYINKRLSLTNSLFISVIFEAIGNIFLSKYILLSTIKNTINFEEIFRQQELIREGYISLGAALMSSALIMINVTIFALPMSSTHIMFSGLAGVMLVAFADKYSKLITTSWLVFESLIWIFSPVLAMGITYLMFQAIQKYFFNQKDARKRVIKFIPYQVSITFTFGICVLIVKPLIEWPIWTQVVVIVFVPFSIFFLCIFSTRFYMIRQANKESNYHIFTIFINCLKFWDSSLLIKAYFGDQAGFERRISKYKIDVSRLVSETILPEIGEEDVPIATQSKQKYRSTFINESGSEESLQAITAKSKALTQSARQPFNFNKNKHHRSLKSHQKSNYNDQSIVDKLFKVPLIISTCLLAMAHGSNEVNVSAPTAAMLFLLNDRQNISNDEAYQGMAIGLLSLIVGVLTLGKRYLHKYRKKFMKTTLSNGFIANTSASIILLFSSFLGFPCSCTYLMIRILKVLNPLANIFVLSRLQRGKTILKAKKTIKVGLFFIGIILLSSALSIFLFTIIYHLDNAFKNQKN